MAAGVSSTLRVDPGLDSRTTPFLRDPDFDIGKRWDSRGLDFDLADCSRLELLYEPATPAIVDIVLVAGLGGHFLKTWEAPDRTVWPIHLLPRYIPQIRVLSFQYNTSIKGTTTERKISDHARELLDRLELDRDGDRNGSAAIVRPLIFVGHSLGGMLIKKALELAHSDTLRYQQLWDMSRGAMFFATPHFGMDRGTWTYFAAVVLRLNAPIPGISPTRNMLQEIGLCSDVFLRITDDFEHLQKELAFVNYIEGNTIQGLDTVLVDARSARIDSGKALQHQLEGDHMGICKFRRDARDQPEYTFKLVHEGIRYLIHEAPKALDLLELEAKRALYSLCPRGFHGYFMTKEPTEGTCDWIAERKDFQDWLGAAEDKQMLWIQGPAASGKSYLARHMITDLIPSAGQEVAHCFLTDAVPGRRNIEALLRATLYHALRLEPKLVPKVLLETFREAEQAEDSDREIWTREILIAMWPDAIATVIETRSLTIVVDGFDQMARECQQDFVDCLGSFESRIRPGNKHRLRVLLLSREYQQEGTDGLPPPPGLDKFQTYKMTLEDTLADVARTIMADLRDADYQSLLSDTGEPLLALCQAIIQGSSGTYRAATMTVEELKRIREDGDVRTTKELLERIPRDTTGLCDRILKRMHEDESSLSLVQQVLRWAVFQEEPLRETEFDIAVAVGKALDQNPGGHSISGQELERLLAGGTIRATALGYCGQAIEFGNGYLALVHGDFKERLTSRKGELASVLGYMDQGLSQAALASVCIIYLTMEYFAIPSTPLQSGDMDRWKGKVRKRIQDHPFVRYAALFWLKHLEAARACRQPIHPLANRSLLLLQDGNTGYAKSWTEVWWSLRGAIKEYPGPWCCPGIWPAGAEKQATTQAAPSASGPIRRMSATGQTPYESAKDEAVRSERTPAKNKLRSDSQVRGEQTSHRPTMPLSVEDSDTEYHQGEFRGKEAKNIKPEVPTLKVTGRNRWNFGATDDDSIPLHDGRGQEKQPVRRSEHVGGESRGDGHIHYRPETTKAPAEKSRVAADQGAASQHSNSLPGLEAKRKLEHADLKHKESKFGMTAPTKALDDSVKVESTGLGRPADLRNMEPRTKEAELRVRLTESAKVTHHDAQPSIVAGTRAAIGTGGRESTTDDQITPTEGPQRGRQPKSEQSIESFKTAKLKDIGPANEKHVEIVEKAARTTKDPLETVHSTPAAALPDKKEPGPVKKRWRVRLADKLHKVVAGKHSAV